MAAWLGVCAVAAAIGVVGGRMMPFRKPNALQRALEARIDDWRARRRGEDPFATLAVQMRLSRITAEIDRLERDPGFARGFHLKAAMLAYDDLLDEGCRLAGVGVVEGEGSVHRLLAESELRARGWTW